MPKNINQPLSDADIHRIKRNWRFLKENLFQHEIRDDFMVEAIWDLPDFEKIDAEKTPEEKNEAFLKLLLQSGPGAYKVFITALQKKNSIHIIERLENTELTKKCPEPSGKHEKKLFFKNHGVFFHDIHVMYMDIDTQLN